MYSCESLFGEIICKEETVVGVSGKFIVTFSAVHFPSKLLLWLFQNKGSKTASHSNTERRNTALPHRNGKLRLHKRSLFRHPVRQEVLTGLPCDLFPYIHFKDPSGLMHVFARYLPPHSSGLLYVVGGAKMMVLKKRQKLTAKRILMKCYQLCIT